MTAAALVSMLVIFAVWETAAPAHPLRHRPLQRWAAALGLFLINIAVAYWLVPALKPASTGPGLMPALLRDSLVAGVVASVLLLDLAEYALHRLFHAIPWLWRVHRVHHCDSDFDLATGFAHHPLEAIAMQGAVGAFVALAGLPVEGYLAYSLLGQVSNFYTHANVSLGARGDAALRAILVSPAMHRVHHAIAPALHNRNFGTTFSFWDRLFGTYATPPATAADVGLPDVSRDAPPGLGTLLLMPFAGTGGGTQ